MLYTYLNAILILTCFRTSLAAIAVNATILEGVDTPMCVFLRENVTAETKDFSNLTVYCSCAILSNRTVLTSQKCYVQKTWYIYKVVQSTNGTNETSFVQNAVLNISQVGDLALVTFNGTVFPEPFANFNEYLFLNYSYVYKQCHMLAYRAPDNEPLRLNRTAPEIISDIFRFEPKLQKIPVSVSNYERSNCERKLNKTLEFPYIKKQFLCVEPRTKHELFDTCLFDIGAPIFCGPNSTLVGVLEIMQNRPPNGKLQKNSSLPMSVPSSCFTNLTEKLRILKEYTYVARNAQHEDTYKLITEYLRGDKSTASPILISHILFTLFTMAFTYILH